MSRLLDYIEAHEDNFGDDPSRSPVDFDILLEKVNEINWVGVDKYVEDLLKSERPGQTTGD